MTFVTVTPLSAAIREAQECLDQRRDGKLSTVCEKRLRQALNMNAPNRLQVTTQLMTALLPRLHFHLEEWTGTGDSDTDKKIEDLEELSYYLHIAYHIADVLIAEAG